MTISPSNIVRLQSVIAASNWQQFDGIYIDGSTVFDDLVRLIDPLSSDEAGLVIDLLSDYLIIREYMPHCRDMLRKLVADGITSVMVAPLKRYSDTIKSGDAVAYQMGKAAAHVGGIDAISVASPISLTFTVTTRTTIVVDDFVGSGMQFFQMMDDFDHYVGDPNFRPDYLAVIAIQDKAREDIEKCGVSVISKYSRPLAIEAIASRYGHNLQQLYGLYDGIEKRASVPLGFERGFAGSEALVTMSATPDNTLPIFWNDGGGTWPAPFPR